MARGELFGDSDNMGTRSPVTTTNGVDDTQLRDNIIHGLRSKGWSKVDAEEEADSRIARMHQNARHFK